VPVPKVIDFGIAKFDKARPLTEQALNLSRRLPPEKSVFAAGHLSVLGWVYLEQGDVAQAETLCDLAWQASLPPYLNAPRRITESLERLVQLYETWGKPAPAGEWKQKLAAFQQANKASDNKSKTP
jgi:tetratricopeptide (TPR) repeat protein